MSLEKTFDNHKAYIHLARIHLLHLSISRRLLQRRLRLEYYILSLIIQDLFIPITLQTSLHNTSISNPPGLINPCLRNIPSLSLQLLRVESRIGRLLSKQIHPSCLNWHLNPSKRLFYHPSCGTALSCHLIFSGCRSHSRTSRMGLAHQPPADFQDMPRSLQTAILGSPMVHIAQTLWADMGKDIRVAERTFLLSILSQWYNDKVRMTWQRLEPALTCNSPPCFLRSSYSAVPSNQEPQTPLLVHNSRTMLGSSNSSIIITSSNNSSNNP